MSLGTGSSRTDVEHRPTVTFRPTTTAGWWAVGLAGAFFALVFTAPVLPRAAVPGFVCGLAGAITALTAIVRDRERAVTVFAALLPLAIAVAFVLTELITGSP